MSTATAGTRIEKAAELGDEARQALRALILSLADSKRVLGLRYSDRMLGAPTLEAGIAASSMAQDEWGHARLTYALLGDFGDEPKAQAETGPKGTIAVMADGSEPSEVTVDGAAVVSSTAARASSGVLAVMMGPAT